MPMRCRLAAAGVVAFALLLAPVPASADNITFNTYFVDTAATGGPNLPTDFAGGAAVHGGAFSSAWTWDYAGDASGHGTVYHGLISLGTSSNPSLSHAACIGSGGDCTSNAGGYAGYEYMYFNFDLPVDATNVVLHVAQLDADDRVVLSVNDTQLGGYKYSWTYGTPTVNAQMTGAGGTVDMTFARFASLMTWDDQSLFNIGGSNYLRFWVNNTHTGVIGTARPHDGPGYLDVDPSALYTYGWISYDTGQTVPEPASLLLVGVGFGLLRLVRRHRA